MKTHNEVKHTPGPWELKRQKAYIEMAKIEKRELAEHEGYSRDNNGGWLVSGTDCGIAIAHCKLDGKRGQWDRPDPEGQANARLIASAPTMKTLGNNMAHAIGEYGKNPSIENGARMGQACIDWDAAISKAEGK